MPKYKVQVCYEAWQYYDIEVDADDGEAADDKAMELWKEDCDLFTRREELDDGNGIIITDCKEIKEDQLSSSDSKSKSTVPC